MHITHINLARGFSGGERQTVLLIDYLAKQGIYQTMVCREDSPLRHRLASVPKLRFSAANHMFVGHWKGGAKTDLYHAHDAKAAHWAFIETRFNKRPYIVTRRVPNPLKRFNITPLVYKKAFAIVAISEKIREILRRYNPGLNPLLIPSASSALPCRPENVEQLRRRLRGRFVIGHIGMLLNKQKGQKYLIEAARLLKGRYPELHFLLLGKGEDEARFKTQAADLENIEFTGFVENPGDYLAAMDLFVFPSLYEGLGSSLLDAMFYGLPIIATRVGGIPDLVKDDENGLLIPPADSRALADAIAWLYEHGDIRNRYAEAGRKTVAEFSAETMGQRYLDLYRQVTRYSQSRTTR